MYVSSVILGGLGGWSESYGFRYLGLFVEDIVRE